MENKSGASVEQRLKKNPSHPHLWLHVVMRSLSLLVLGLILANAGAGDPTLIHMKPSVWALLALTGAILFWMVYPKNESRKTLYAVLRYSGLVLMIVMFVFWMPIPGVVWHVQNQAVRCTIWAINFSGWLLVPAATLLINHFDLFGLRQVWLHFKGRPYTYLPFRTPLFYKLVRHPLYVGWLVSFAVVPTMSVGHLMFSGVMTGYILIAIQFEERDLRELHGEAYETWRRKTGMFMPRPAADGTPSVTSPRRQICSDSSKCHVVHIREPTQESFYTLEEKKTGQKR